MAIVLAYVLQRTIIANPVGMGHVRYVTSFHQVCYVY